jgi:hypothetical protein
MTDSTDREVSLKTLVIFCAIVVVVQVLGAIVVLIVLPSWSERASFGEMFGGANTLFSGLALAGVVYAILLQREDLRLQQRELELTRAELGRTAAAQEGTDESMRQQVELQNRLVAAQLLRDRFDMYWRTYAPLTDDEIRTFLSVPDDLMSEDRYEAVKSDANALRRYLTLARTYEYMAFTYAMRKAGIPDALGDQWLDRWAKDLTAHGEFLEINQYYRPYYPQFALFIDSLHDQPSRAGA